MATGLRIEERLDGAINFSSWKARLVLILQDIELWDIVNNTTTNPMVIPTDLVAKATFDKRDIKAHANAGVWALNNDELRLKLGWGS